MHDYLGNSTALGGVDEAGRGPVIGPMVIVGVALSREREFELTGLLRDSKKLTPRVREKLFPVISRAALNTVVRIVQPEVIDEWIMKFRGGLNLLEAKVFAEIISELGVRTVYVDSCDVKPERFSERIRRLIDRDVRIISETRADERYPVVSAASIVAKVLRDREIRKLRRIYGNFGSGYSSDMRTIKFLEEYYLRNGQFPPIVRRSYKTICRIRRRLGEVTRRCLK